MKTTVYVLYSSHYVCVCMCVREKMYVLMHQDSLQWNNVMAGSRARLLWVKDGLSTRVCVDLCVRKRARQTEEDLCAQAASVQMSVCEAEGWRCFALNGTLTWVPCVKLQGVLLLIRTLTLYVILVCCICDCGIIIICTLLSVTIIGCVCAWVWISLCMFPHLFFHWEEILSCKELIREQRWGYT